MSGFVYLMKNGDLYKLGYTSDLKNEANKLKPGEIISPGFILLASFLKLVVHPSLYKSPFFIK